MLTLSWLVPWLACHFHDCRLPKSKGHALNLGVASIPSVSSHARTCGRVSDRIEENSFAFRHMRPQLPPSFPSSLQAANLPSFPSMPAFAGGHHSDCFWGWFREIIRPVFLASFPKIQLPSVSQPQLLSPESCPGYLDDQPAEPVHPL